MDEADVFVENFDFNFQSAICRNDGKKFLSRGDDTTNGVNGKLLNLTGNRRNQGLDPFPKTGGLASS